MGNAHPEQVGKRDDFEEFDAKYVEEDEGIRKMREEKVKDFKKKQKPKIRKTYRFSEGETLKTNVKDFFLIDDGDQFDDNTDDGNQENELVLREEDEDDRNFSLNVEAEQELDIGALLPHTPSWRSPQDGIRFVMMKPEKFSVENTMNSANDGEVKTVLYFPKHKKLVSLSNNLIVWSTGAFGRQTHSIHMKDKHIIHMIKWNENEILYGGKDCNVKCISIAKNFKILAMFRESQLPIVRLLRLDDDRFAAMNEEGIIFVFSYSHQLFLRRLRKSFEGSEHTVTKNPLMIRSKVYPGCLYHNIVDKKLAISSPNNSYKVILVDYEKDKCLLEFTNHPKIYTIETILTKAGKEVLLIGTHKHWITMVNTDTGVTSILNTSKKSIGYPTTAFCYYNRYILIGTNRGHISLLDVKRNYLDLKVHKSNHRINDIKFYYYFQNVSTTSRFSVLRNDDSLRLFTCSTDGTIKAVQLKLVSRDDEEEDGGENGLDEERSLLKKGENVI